LDAGKGGRRHVNRDSERIYDEYLVAAAVAGDPAALSRPMAWVMWVAYLAALLAFAGGVYALWQLSGATDAVVAVKWGVASLFLFQVTTMCKGFMGNRMEANRLLREIKRVELQVSLLRDGTARPR
jgi:hypothetical protein